MAKRNTKSAKSETHNIPISRSYDPYSMEQRIYNLEKNSGSTPSPTPTSWDYSTNEVDTNQKWVDGSEIYCKVLDYSSSPAALPGNSEKTFNGVLPSNAQIIDADIIYGSSSFKGIAKAYVTLANGNLGVNSMHAVNMYYAVIRYIKTEA